MTKKDERLFFVEGPSRMDPLRLHYSNFENNIVAQHNFERLGKFKLVIFSSLKRDGCGTFQ